MSLLVFLVACNQYKVVAGEEGEGVNLDDGDDGTTPTVVEEDYSEYDGAQLVVRQPASGAFLPWGDPADFEAVVIDSTDSRMRPMTSIN